MQRELSILIPTRDYVCYKLVADLHEQAERLGVSFEILVAEDGSRSSFTVIANHKITELPHCRHIIRRENAGRAAIRNFLMQEAEGDFLLFMDADGQIVRDDFLGKYIQAARQGHKVICGGVLHPQQWHDPRSMLRWKYENAYEQKHGTVSQQFRSFSFMISRDVARCVHFDERYTGYGYEDVQFGLDLQRAGYAVCSIDNPLLNSDIEDNATFLRKTEEAMRSLHRFREEIGENVKIFRIYSRYRLFSPLLRFSFRLFGPLMRRNLLSANPSLTLFNLYKLGYFSAI